MLPVLEEFKSRVLDSDIDNDIKTILGNNILKKLIRPPPERKKVVLQSSFRSDDKKSGDTLEIGDDGEDDDGEDDDAFEIKEGGNKVLSTAVKDPEEKETNAENAEISKKLENEKQSVKDIKNSIFLGKIAEKLKKYRDASGNYIKLSTFYDEPGKHPYFPVPTKTDWIYSDIDELIRYAAIFTALFEIVMEKYDAIVKFEEESLKKSNPTAYENKNKREEYMIRRGESYIAYSKAAQGYASMKRGVQTASQYVNYFTGNNKKSGGSKRIRNIVNASKRVKRPPQKYIRINHTIKKGGGITSSLQRTGNYMNYQLGVSKASNAIASYRGFKNYKPEQRINFNISHNSKYELLLYLEKIFDLYTCLVDLYTCLG